MLSKDRGRRKHCIATQPFPIVELAETATQEVLSIDADIKAWGWYDRCGAHAVVPYPTRLHSLTASP